MSNKIVIISLKEYKALLSARKELDTIKCTQGFLARVTTQMKLDRVIDAKRETNHIAEKKTARDAKKTARKNASSTQ